MTGHLRRVLVASLVGSAIEWFDFFLYGSATAIVFNRLFFPAADPLVSLLLAYLSFALPFFIRPLGGVIFSHIGDRVGRKSRRRRLKLLTVTIAMVATYLSRCIAPHVVQDSQAVSNFGARHKRMENSYHTSLESWP